jgi:hypothetical protein
VAGGRPTRLTHRQFLAWAAWRDWEDWDRRTKLDYYLARQYAADHLTKSGESIDANKGIMELPRELKAPPRPGKAGKAGFLADAEGVKVLQAVGGKGVRHWVRHPDGSLTDAKTGEPVNGN